MDLIPGIERGFVTILAVQRKSFKPKVAKLEMMIISMISKNLLLHIGKEGCLHNTMHCCRDLCFLGQLGIPQDEHINIGQNCLVVMYTTLDAYNLEKENKGVQNKAYGICFGRLLKYYYRWSWIDYHDAHCSLENALRLCFPISIC